MPTDFVLLLDKKITVFKDNWWRRWGALVIQLSMSKHWSIDYNFRKSSASVTIPFKIYLRSPEEKAAAPFILVPNLTIIYNIAIPTAM